METQAPPSSGWLRIAVPGLLLWVVAQALPAYTGTGWLGAANTVIGLTATLFVWDLALLEWSHSILWALALLAAWSTNIWFILALVARLLRRPGGAFRLAMAAVVCSGVGLAVLLAHGPPEETVTVEVGSFVWFASTLIVALALV